MSASSVDAQGGSAEANGMPDLLLAVGFVLALVLLGLVAQRYGADTRFDRRDDWF